MKKISFLFLLLPCYAMAETDAQLHLKDVLGSVRAQCSGISIRLEPLKKMAGIGTAVNAVGTVVGAGGVASGIAKWNKDKDVAGSMGEKWAIDAEIEKLKQKELSPENQEAWKRFSEMASDLDWHKIEIAFDKMADDFDRLDEQTQEKQLKELEAKSAAADKKMKEKQAESDTYGNLRTGLFAANTATSVAGAVVSSKTTIDDTLEGKIKACADSMNMLRDAQTRVRVEDGAASNANLLAQTQNILDKCGEYKYIDTKSLNKLATGATVTNSVGATTGVVATITSAVGTSRKVSDVDLKSENAVAEMDEIGKINVASNVLGGVNAATSLAGTILNATQINKIKEVINISTECEEALTW